MPQASLFEEVGSWGGFGSWDQEMCRWRCNPGAIRRYLVLVIGAQAVPGLWVVLSVPTKERVGGG